MKTTILVTFFSILLLSGCNFPHSQNISSFDKNYTQNMMQQYAAEEASRNKAKRIAEYESQKEVEKIRSKRMAEYEAQKKVEEANEKAHQQYLASRRDDIKLAEIKFLQTQQELLSSYATDEVKIFINDMMRMFNDDRNFLANSQPFYDNDRIDAAILNTYTDENKDALNKLIKGSRIYILESDHKKRLIRKIKQMETPHDSGVIRNNLVECEKGNGFGEVLDVLGEFTSGKLGLAVSAAGKVNDFTNFFECKLRAGVNKCIINYYCKSGNDRFYEREEKIIKDPYTPETLKLTVFGLTLSGLKDIEYLTMEVNQDIKGKSQSHFYTWKIDPSTESIIPYDSQKFLDSIAHTYKYKE